jgi:hypothetical protein
MKRNFAHRVKFGLWDFARQNPRLGAPIRHLGRMVMSGADAHHRRQLEALSHEIMPTDRYCRPAAVATQVWVVTDGARPDDLRGLRLWLNHLRIPYRQGPAEECAIHGKDLALILNPTARPVVGGEAAVLDFVGRYGPAARLLPHQDGLRSEFAAALLVRLRTGLRHPLVTGMLPSGIALRLDDVNGKGLRDYLAPILAHGWRPNLGLFLDAFAGNDHPERVWLAELAQTGAVSLSPHAFAENRLIFFDLAWHRAYEPDEFAAIWDRVSGIMRANGLPVSPVINAHFHAMCGNAAAILANEGMRFYFSEYALGSHTLVPGPHHWPSGDPVLSTGRLHPSGLVQISAGDSMGSLWNPQSQYDFMMHVAPGDVESCAERVVRRLRLSLQCGFPAYVTSHESLLVAQLDRDGCERLWDAVDMGLGETATAKVGLDHLGERCLDHRNAIIWSVGMDGKGEIQVELRGDSGGHAPLRVLGAGEDKLYDAAACQRTVTIPAHR